jgi:hypothetical protein
MPVARRRSIVGAVERATRSRVTAITALVLIAVAASIVAGIGRRVHRATETRQIPSTRTLAISVRASDVVVSGVSGSVASVESRELWTGSDPPVGVLMLGPVLRLRSTCPGSRPLDLLWSFGARCSVRYIVRTPRQRAARIVIDEGDATLAGLAGPLSVTMQTGDLRASGLLSARATIRLGVGDAQIAFARAPSSLRVVVGVGDASALLPPGRYAIAARASVGDVRIGPGIVEDPSSPRTIVVTSGVGDVHVDARG